MESASAIFYGPTSATGERPRRWRHVIIHEIAHQWWGNGVGEQSAESAAELPGPTDLMVAARPAD